MLGVIVFIASVDNIFGDYLDTARNVTNAICVRDLISMLSRTFLFLTECCQISHEVAINSIVMKILYNATINGRIITVRIIIKKVVPL